MTDEKMRTLIPKLIFNDNIARKTRKLKKSERRERPQPKVYAAVKKPHSLVQQNRFTNIHELSSLPSSFMQLQNMFGTLVLDFSKDPVQVKISDVTGNYELNVHKESLSEFKMKIVLGQNPKCKPTFSIFLGDCQCYPELPEGALELKENDGTGSQIGCFGEGSEIETEIDTVHAAQDTLRTPDDAVNNDTFESDFSASLLALFGGGEMNKTVTSHNNNKLSCEARQMRIGESQKLESETNAGEIVVKMIPSRKGGSKLRKGRPLDKQPDEASRRAPKKHSTYRNNLEGFVKFLMNDRVCGKLLGKLKSGSTVAVGKRGDQKIVNYSDGHEYRIVFSQDTNSKNVTNTKPANDERSSLSVGVDGSLTKNDEESKADGIRVLFERRKFEKEAFVEQLKKELEEWKTRDAKTVPNVEIVDDANSSSSSADIASDDSNVVTVYEDIKTSKKLDTEFDDATISNNCWTEAVKVESTEKCFSDVVKEKEEPENREKESLDGVNEDEEFLAWMKSESIHVRREDEKYVAPIPLGSTSTADIEEMWLTFVKMFHHSSQLTKKTDEPIPLDMSSSSFAEPIKLTLSGEEVAKRNTDTCAYPGQHCLPYFVEESIRRVNSMLGKRHDPIVCPASGRKPEEIICQPRIPVHCPFNSKYSHDVNDNSFNPKNYTPQAYRSQYFHHPGKFSVKRSRIFFNPHATIGDWHH